MFEIELPEGPSYEVPLVSRTTRGVHAAPARIESAIVLGVPQCLALTPERVADDQELRHFIEAVADKWAYYLVVFSCTFAPAEDQELATAWIRINLANEPDSSVLEPIVTSMEPTILDQIRDLSYSAKISVPCVLEARWPCQGSRQHARSSFRLSTKGRQHQLGTFRRQAAHRSVDSSDFV